MSDSMVPRSPKALIAVRPGKATWAAGQVKSALAAFMFLATLYGCAQDLRQDVLTTYDLQQVQNRVTNSTSLTDAEKADFAAALQRDGYQPYGKTVARIISDQGAYDVAQAAAEARASTLRHALDHDVEIRPSSISIQRGTMGQPPYTFDDPYNDVDTFTFVVTNEGSNVISYFSATATLENQGGNILFSGTLEDADDLLPGRSKTIPIRVTYPSLADPKLARNTSIENTVVQYSVDRIDFDNGTKAIRGDLESE